MSAAWESLPTGETGQEDVLALPDGRLYACDGTEEIRSCRVEARLRR